MTRALLAAALVAGGASGGAPPPPGADVAPCAPERWPLLERYAAAFLSPDGRVIDRTTGDRTTSEGQAYALFHALVAGDRALFDRVLRWTEDNLADGDLASHLPAWHWGRARDGAWRVLDRNPASDADLWVGYALLEAGRLWREPRYRTLAGRVLSQVATREVVELPALGPTLLPAPDGFAVRGGRAWRLNPSYLAPQLLRRLVSAGVPGPWQAVLESGLRVVQGSAGNGVVADWVLYAPPHGFAPDPESGRVGSYDAIRAYLWAGMLPAGDPAARALAPATGGLLRVLLERGALPERIDARTLHGTGRAPVGFYAALLPLASDDAAARAALQARLASSARGGLYGDPPTYYDQNLALFATGFAEGRYRFRADGALETAWEARCEGSR